MFAKLSVSSPISSATCEFRFLRYSSFAQAALSTSFDGGIGKGWLTSSMTSPDIARKS